MERPTDERVDEMIVPKCRVWIIEEKESHIQDRFHVQIVYGSRHDQDQWIGVKGEQDNRELAKGYIKALVAPTEGITVNYPEEIHDVLNNPTVLVKLEQQSKAVVMFSPGQRGELRILGCDTLSVTLALSTVEDLINKYLQEQTNESATSAFKAPSQQATKRLDKELRRLSSENGVVIISEDDFSDMNNAVKRTILGWLQENQGPQTLQHIVAETSTGRDVPDSPDVLILENDPDEPMPRETVSPGTNLSIMLQDTSFRTPENSPEMESSPDGKQQEPGTRAGDESPSMEEVDPLNVTQNLLTSLAQDRGYSAQEIQVVFETHGRDLAASNFLQLLVANRKLRVDTDRKLREDASRKLREEADRKLWEEADRKLREEADRKLREDSDRKLREDADRKLREDADRKLREDADRKLREDADRKLREDADRNLRKDIDRKLREDAGTSQSSQVKSVDSCGAADSPLARAACSLQLQFGSGSASPPTVQSARPPPKALDGYLIQLSKDMTEEGPCECLDELKKKNARRQKLLQEAYEKQSSSVKKPIRHKKHKKKSSNTSHASPGNNHATVAHGDASGMVHDLTANNSDSDVEILEFTPSTKKTQNPAADISQMSKGKASELDSFSLPFSVNSACVSTTQRNMLELSGTVGLDTNTHTPGTTILQERKGKASELDDFSLPFTVNEPIAASCCFDNVVAGNADSATDVCTNAQIVDICGSDSASNIPQSAAPKQNGTISSRSRNKCRTMSKPQLAQGSIEAAAASAVAVVTNVNGLALKKMRYTQPSVGAANPTHPPLLWQQQQQQQIQQQIQQQHLLQQQQLQCQPQQQQNQPRKVLPNPSTNNHLRYIVIDGSNVAMAHGNDSIFSCRGIQLCIDYFRQRGHKEITAFVPQWRTQTAIRPDYPIRDQYLLEKLKKEGVLVFTPCRRVPGRNIVCYDDRFHLRLAHTTDGVIVSNDNFRDLWNDNVEWRDVIENRLLMYSFVGDLFMVPDDPLGRKGPTLDELLTKPVPIGNWIPQYANMSVQRSLRPWVGNGPQQQPANVLVPQNPQQQRWPTNQTWQQVRRPQQPQWFMPGTWPTVAATSSSAKQTQAAPTQQKLIARSQLDTTRLTKQLNDVFPECEDIIHKILTNHPSETDINTLSGYVLEVAQ